ncbi:MAG: hypothetical protein JWN66_3466 [Sphingomonas bacterium]|nr:hypothetical protein [Sphingomonas bacterium]
MMRDLIGYGLIAFLLLGAAAIVIAAIRNQRKPRPPHRRIDIVDR